MTRSYPPLQWRDEWRIGIDAIDRQHQRLIGLVNILLEALEMKRCPDMYKSILTGLVSYVNTHFRDEEFEMRRIGFPDLEQQMRLHQQLKDTVQQMVQQVKAGGNLDKDHLAAFLYDWVHNHLAVEDAKIGQYIKEKQITVYQTKK